MTGAGKTTKNIHFLLAVAKLASELLLVITIMDMNMTLEEMIIITRAGWIGVHSTDSQSRGTLTGIVNSMPMFRDILHFHSNTLNMKNQITIMTCNHMIKAIMSCRMDTMTHTQPFRMRVNIMMMVWTTVILWSSGADGQLPTGNGLL